MAHSDMTESDNRGDEEAGGRDIAYGRRAEQSEVGAGAVEEDREMPSRADALVTRHMIVENVVLSA